MALSSTRSLQQNVDLRAGCAILGKLTAQDVGIDPARRSRLALKARDVGKPQPEVDHLDGVCKTDSAECRAAAFRGS